MAQPSLTEKYANLLPSVNFCLLVIHSLILFRVGYSLRDFIYDKQQSEKGKMLWGDKGHL